MYFNNELHEANRVKGGSEAKAAPKELELARKLIDTLAGPFKPVDYEDEYRKNVEKMIQQKRKGVEIKQVEQPKPDKVVDIMEALRRSLESTSKPSAKKKAAKTEEQGRLR